MIDTKELIGKLTDKELLDMSILGNIEGEDNEKLKSSLTFFMHYEKNNMSYRMFIELENSLGMLLKLMQQIGSSQYTVEHKKFMINKLSKFLMSLDIEVSINILLRAYLEIIKEKMLSIVIVDLIRSNHLEIKDTLSTMQQSKITNEIAMKIEGKLKNYKDDLLMPTMMQRF